MMKAIKNIKVITTEGIIEDHAVVYDQTIREILPEKQLPPGCRVVDGGGAYLAPGLIDLHIHGCAGYDTMDDDDQALKVMANRLVSTGVTAFLPTTMTMDRARIERALDRIAAAMNGEPGEGAQILGCNLEGPFLSRENKGAHDERYIIGPGFCVASALSRGHPGTDRRAGTGRRFGLYSATGRRGGRCCSWS